MSSKNHNLRFQFQNQCYRKEYVPWLSLINNLKFEMFLLMTNGVDDDSSKSKYIRFLSDVAKDIHDQQGQGQDVSRISKALTEAKEDLREKRGFTSQAIVYNFGDNTILNSPHAKLKVRSGGEEEGWMLLGFILVVYIIFGQS
eukprot:TRINITY_DN2651_c0_g1_i1.p1 TRINITY_DN2651_c0_g1~~TRINITY_DN2651_c0_g1_i1.p1  ORF type:complete len:143 (-),score=25.82 TRINITY_DN2651_c0_g1_i1:691-1119(-)